MPSDGELECLKLQVTYELAHIQEEDKLEKVRNFFQNEINNILKDIVMHNVDTKKEQDTLVVSKKMFSFLILKTKQNILDSLGDFDESTSIGIDAEREINKAMDVVFPKVGIPTFVTLPPESKISEINYFSHVIMGIRALNKELGYAGAGLKSLEELKASLSTSLLNQVKIFYHSVKEVAEKYSMIYENVDFALLDKNQEITMEEVRKKIVYFRQVLSYLSMLMDDLQDSSMAVEELVDQYSAVMDFLINKTGKNKTHINKKIIYPKFEQISKLYGSFQEQSFKMEIRRRVFEKIKDFVKQSSISPEFNSSPFEDIFISTRERSDEGIFSFEPGVYHNGVSILLPHTTADYGDIKLEFQGFCIVTMLKVNGLIVEGKTKVVAKFKDKYLVFYNQKAVQDFLDDPERILKEIVEFVRANSYLINLLDLSEDFPNANLNELFRNKDNETYKYRSTVTMVDKEIQTVVHPIKQSIDRNYVWNEWELKKQALKLADLIKKKTVSTQTYLSHFRRENDSQIYPLVNKKMNTMHEKGTSLVIEKKFVPALRKYDVNH